MQHLRETTKPAGERKPLKVSPQQLSQQGFVASVESRHVPAKSAQSKARLTKGPKRFQRNEPETCRAAFEPNPPALEVVKQPALVESTKLVAPQAPQPPQPARPHVLGFKNHAGQADVRRVIGSEAWPADPKTAPRCRWMEATVTRFSAWENEGTPPNSDQKTKCPPKH